MPFSRSLARISFASVRLGIESRRTQYPTQISPSGSRCEGSRPAARRRAAAAAASASSGNGPTLTQRLDAMERAADSSGAAAVAASSDVAFPSASADSAATSLTRRIGVPLVAAADLVWGSGAYHADHAPKQ